MYLGTVCREDVTDIEKMTRVSIIILEMLTAVVRNSTLLNDCLHVFHPFCEASRRRNGVCRMFCDRQIVLVAGILCRG